MTEECSYKVLLLGDSTVGKTCFLLQYTERSFQAEHMSTIGLDYRLKNMILNNGKKVKLQIWDTAGQDRFRSVTKTYYKGADGILLIYDVTNIQTYENVKNWISQIKQESSPHIVIYIIGNKIDRSEDRKIQTEQGQKLADEFNLDFFETSAKTGENVNEAFESLVNKIDKVCPKSDQVGKGRKLTTRKKKKNICCS